MFGQALEGVFTHAAVPQKVVLTLLLGMIPGILAAACLALRANTPDNFWRCLIAEVRLAGPALGLFVGGLNSFHMGETIQRLPFDPTLKQLVPGIFEISTFVSVGALVGLTAAIANATLGFIGRGKRTS